MAIIQPIVSPAIGKEVTDKLNEIIDWLNGATDATRVTDIAVNGKTITLTYINGTTKNINTNDTTYQLATTSKNGLISANNVYLISALARQVTVLNNACHAIEVANEAIDNLPDPNDNVEDSGGGDGDGGDNGDDGGHGGGGGEF